MNGYLSHLVGRTLGLTLPLLPASGNPFEPASLAEPELAAGESAEPVIAPSSRPARAAAVKPAAVPSDDSSNEASVHPAARRFDTLLAQSAAPRAAAAGREPVTEPAPAMPSPAGPVSAASLEIVTPTTAPTAVARDAEVQAPPESPPYESSAARRGVLRLPRKPRAAEESPRTAPEVIADAAPSAVPPKAGRQTRQSGEPVAVRPHSPVTLDGESAALEAETRAPAEASSLVKRAAPLAPMQRAAPPPAVTAAAASTPPDVHITIGRVEIRAQTAPARARPVANPPRALRPAMSLTDYLKRRGERP